MFQAQASPAQLLAWLLKHASEVPLIISKTTAVVQADGLNDKWAAFKELGDILVPIASDFPRDTDAGALSVEAVEGQYQAAGLLDNFRQIKELLPALLEIIALLRSIGILK
jgi:hypothetical protein